MVAVGSAASPLVRSGTNLKGVHVRIRHTGATGMARAAYFRLHMAGGATTSADGIRGMNYVESAVAGAHGGHISVFLGVAPAAVTGLATGVRGTLHLPNRACAIGTGAAVQAEIYLEGNDAANTGVLSLIRAIVDGGNAAAKRKVVNLMEVVAEVGTQANKYMVCNEDVNGAGATAGGLQVRVNGTQYWIPLYTI